MNRLERRHKKWMGKKLAAQMAKIDPIKQKLFLDLMETGTKGINQSKIVLRAAGILGERSGCDAWVEEVIKPPEGGTFLKLLGNTYLFKGRLKQNEVYSLELVKYIFFTLPKRFLPVLILLLPFFLIFRKWFYKKIYRELFEIDWRTISKIDVIDAEGCQMVKELKRATSQALRDTFGIDLQGPFYPIGHPRYHPERRWPDPIDAKNKILGWIMVLVARFMFVFMEQDTAYRFRIQDAFGEVGSGRDALGDIHYKRDIKEFWRVFELLISRDNNAIFRKWKFVKMIMKAGFFLIPDLKRFVVNILKNLDPSKIRMDEADWYFSLGYSSYNFFGLSKEVRFKLREEKDKEKKHVLFFGDNMLGDNVSNV